MDEKVWRELTRQNLEDLVESYKNLLFRIALWMALISVIGTWAFLSTSGVLPWICITILATELNGCYKDFKKYKELYETASSSLEIIIMTLMVGGVFEIDDDEGVY